MPVNKETLRGILRRDLDRAATRLNEALQGSGLEHLEPTLQRVGRGGALPHWYEQLAQEHTLPNLDGKTVGSVIEMLFLAILETEIFKEMPGLVLRVNPARGVDFPDLELSIKAPSLNFCTSEPFFSAYERLIGSEYDCVVLLTNYQSEKRRPPLHLQILRWRYLEKTEIADAGLCRLARENRDWLLEQNEAWAAKLFRFLAYVNQSDWRAKQLLHLLSLMQDPEDVDRFLGQLPTVYGRYNERRERKNAIPVPESDLEALLAVADIEPRHLGVLDASDNWVVEVQKESGRYPSENEWNRLVSGPLNGQIGMSYALQWRYNFARAFGVDIPAEADQEVPDCE